jgi:hypothetical protein
MSASLDGLHPVMQQALKPLFQVHGWQNWVMLGKDGEARWIVYATSREAALREYPNAHDARPMTTSPEDLALADRVHGRSERDF